MTQDSRQSAEEKEAEELIRQGKNAEALHILVNSTADTGTVHWKHYWLMAQAAKNIGNIQLVDQACKAVLEQNPDFWFARELPKHARGYYSQLGQDEVVERFFREHPARNKIFVEVGAFDGVHYSNVRRLVEQHGWSGVSIEPVVKNFDKLSNSYAGQPVVCVNCAVGEREGIAELNVSSYPHLPDWGSDVATFSESETQRWQHLYGAVWHKEQVPVKKLTSILQAHSLAAVDFLSVDAEGHDLGVLKGLDFSLYQPQMIVVEYNKHRQEIFDYLATRGYLLWLDNGQDLFMVFAQTLRMPSGDSLPDVITFNGAIGRQPYDEIQAAVESGLHDCISVTVEEISCFVIVGGYLGWEIERILERYPKVEIHVFEPSKRYFHRLHTRYSATPRVFCHNLAVSDSTGVAQFFETELEGTGSLHPVKQKEDNATWIAEGARAAENYQVATVRLDDFTPLADKKIDLLWCDVQGHELSVLKGATRILGACSAIFLEVAMYKTMYEGQCLFDELNRYLAAHAFYLRGIGLCNSGNGTGNALWISTVKQQDTFHPVQKSETTVAFDAIRNLLNHHLIAIDYLPKGKQITRKQLEPRALLGCSRFDIVPKCIYAEYRERSLESSFGFEIYEAHLRAFNNCHEDDLSCKSGVKAFTEAFDSLLDSVKKNGFDARRSLVPTGRNGVVIDGAHRVAACLIHRRSLEVVEFDISANNYNYEFFLNKGLSVDYCDAIALAYCRLKPDAYVVTVFPSAVGKEREIREVLKREGEIFYARQVQLSRLGSVNLVRQMYDGEPWVGSFANRFAGAQYKAAECFRTDGPVRVYVFVCNDFEKVKRVKQQIRDLFGISNHSVHINDTHAEAVRLGQLLFNANSIHFLNNAQLISFPRFQAHLDNYKKVLREQGVDGECLCIDGSSVMAAYGIREAHDLDYLHFGYDDLVFDYPPELIGSHNAEIAQHVTTRDDIIFNPRNHFYYDGVKFASIGITRALKAKWTKKRNIRKDYEDIALIDRFVTTPPAPPHVYTPAPPIHGASHTTTVDRQPKIVGLVPARNEKHIITQCLKALALFTDAIVYLDDASTDETPDIVASLADECRIERIIRKQEWHRDEPGDRNAMLQAGREIGGTHFIVIDADEMLTSNLLASPGLRAAILQLKPGDRIALAWIQLWRSLEQYRFDQTVWTWNYKEVIFCDDGRCSYSSEFIHTPRVPKNLTGASYTMQGYEAGLLHFQFVNWRNLLVKQAWYRCLEYIREPGKPVAAINERYAASKDESRLGLQPAPEAWLSGYPFFDRTVYERPDEWREKQVLNWFKQFGRDCFAGLDIWDIPWGDDAELQQESCHESTAHYRVTAIVSAYTSAFFMRGCLEDLLAQTLYQRGELEIIVIDSASPEDEASIVREFQQRSPHIIYHRTNQRETVYQSWNRAIKLARGSYITNANTDDRHRTDAFELMAKTLDALPDVDLVYADVLITQRPNETFAATTTSDSYNWPAWDRTMLLEKGCFIGPQPMWRRSVHDLYGEFDPSYITSGDYEFWLRISQTSQFQHIAQPLGLYLARPDSIEHANESLKQRENAAIRTLYRAAAAKGKLVGQVTERQPLRAAVREASGLAQRGEVERAVKLLLDQGIRVFQNNPVPYLALTEILIRAGRYQDALEVLPEMPPGVAPMLKQELAAICHCALGADLAAQQAALQAAGRPKVKVVLGTLSARLGDLAEAERLFRQAVAADPSCGSGWLSLGMLLWGQGKQEDAWQAVKQAVAVDPLNQEAVKILRDMAGRLVSPHEKALI